MPRADSRRFVLGLLASAVAGSMGGDVADEPHNPDAPTQEPSASRAHATNEEMLAKGRVMADYLRSHPGCFVERACFAAGINPRTYRRWMEHTHEDYRPFQDVVGEALQDHAEKLLEEARRDIDSAEGGSSAWANWHKWLLPKRHPKLFGEQPAEHAVTVDGKISHEHELRGKSADELLATMLSADAVKRGKDEGEDE